MCASNMFAPAKSKTGQRKFDSFFFNQITKSNALSILIHDDDYIVWVKMCEMAQRQ